MWLAKTWTAIDRLSVIWKSDLTDKMKRSFFQALVVLILLYGCITWTLTKHMEKKLDSNYTRILWAILNKSWRQHPTKQQLQPIMKTIKITWTRHVGHCWRSRDKLISDVLLWTPSHGRAKAGHTGRTYIKQLCAIMRCSPEDLPEAMDDRKEWRERFRGICADGMTWWRWVCPGGGRMTLISVLVSTRNVCLLFWFSTKIKQYVILSLCNYWLEWKVSYCLELLQVVHFLASFPT